MKFRLNEHLFLEAADEKPYFKAFITNLGKYNEGELEGDWVEFPVTEKEFNDVLKQIGIGSKNEYGIPYEEWFVTAYESNIEGVGDYGLGEYPSYDELEEMGELVAAITPEDFIAISNIMEVAEDLEDAIEGYNDGKYQFYADIDSPEDLGYFVIEKFYSDELSDDLINAYFDYGRLGRDLKADTYYDAEDEQISAGEYFCDDEDATDEEIGEACIDELGIESINNLDNYFDFKAFGEALEREDFTQTSDGYVETVE